SSSWLAPRCWSRQSWGRVAAHHSRTAPRKPTCPGSSTAPNLPATSIVGNVADVVQSSAHPRPGGSTMSELRFDDRAVIVTGAGRGVGRCHALSLASRGAKVVVADLGGELDGSGSDAGPAHDVVKEIEAAGGEAVGTH